ncbi:MAG: hypothetical protein KDK36_22270, partial [Leptospiraceae bacterium]|nr:hypothetical protein [Leptospiraceae bacterium]
MKFDLKLKNFQIRNLLKLGLLFIFLFYFTCKNPEKNIQEREEAKNKNLLLLIGFRDSGNCLRIETINSTQKNLYCSRLPNGICNTNLLIYTKEEKNKRVVEYSEYLDKYSICKNPIALSGLYTEKLTTDAEIQDIKTNNNFKSINSCEEIGFSNSDKSLFNKDEIIYLNSDRGKLGISIASQANQTVSFFVKESTINEAKDCLN